MAFDQGRFCRLAQDLRHRLLSRLVQALGGTEHPPRRSRLEPAAARLLHTGARGKSGKSQDFTLSGCRLMLRREGQKGRQKAGDDGFRSGRMRWIVGPESGRNGGRKGAQPLIPPGFFACGAISAPHLDY